MLSVSAVYFSIVCLRSHFMMSIKETVRIKQHHYYRIDLKNKSIKIITYAHMREIGGEQHKEKHTMTKWKVRAAYCVHLQFNFARFVLFLTQIRQAHTHTHREKESNFCTFHLWNIYKYIWYTLFLLFIWLLPSPPLSSIQLGSYRTLRNSAKTRLLFGTYILIYTFIFALFCCVLQSAHLYTRETK